MIDCFKPYVVAVFIIYIFNKMAVGIDVFIPINLFTVVLVGLFDIPGLIMLVILKLVLL